MTRLRALHALALVGCAAAWLAACAPAGAGAVSGPFAFPTAAAGAATASPAPAASAASAASPAPATAGLSPVAPGPSMVAYQGANKGYLALPPGLAPGSKAPGVVMIHEWWGLNDQIRNQADLLAKEGYVVLAVDLFGGSYATTQDQARALTGKLDAAAATANLKGAVGFLRARGDVAKVGSLGWCFGGGWSLKLVQAQPDLAAGVIYYGTLESDAAKLKGLPPLLGLFGGDDQGPSPAQVKAFDEALTQAGVTHAVHSYAGAGHAFANPTGGDRFKPEAAADAWAKTLAFLALHLK